MPLCALTARILKINSPHKRIAAVNFNYNFTQYEL